MGSQMIMQFYYELNQYILLHSKHGTIHILCDIGMYKSDVVKAGHNTNFFYAKRVLEKLLFWNVGGILILLKSS